MRSLLLVVGVGISAGFLLAQSDRGTITGTVSDPAGAVVAGAPIQAKNIETGVNYEGATSTTGNYTLAQLPAGAYEVTVSVPGFKKFTRAGLRVQVAQTVRIDIPLEVGATSDSVTVTEAAPLLRTESGELSHNVSVNQMDELPILGIGPGQAGSAGVRNPMAMVELIPGTYWAPNSVVRVNGTPSNSQSFRIEGQEASNTGLPGTPAQSQPSVDAIQEIAIQTSNYSAEFGQVGGGVFNVTMRSGTNQFHGSAYDYFVNEALNSGNPFTNNPTSNPRPVARRNDYGFTGGGPVWIPKVYNGHDKTFFFFNFEQYRERQTVNNQNQTVPTPAYQAGDFSAAITSVSKVIGKDPVTGANMLEGMIYDPITTRTLNGQQVRDQFPNNKIDPKRFDPVAVKIQALFPQPTGPFANAVTSNYLVTYPVSRITTIPSIKADQLIGAKGKLSFFYQRTYSGSPRSTTFGVADGLPDTITTAIGSYTTSPLYRLNYDYTLRPTLLLHFGAGYRSSDLSAPSVNSDGSVQNYNAEKELGLHGGIENHWFPVMTGMLATNGTGGMKNIGSASAINNVDYITQSPSFNATLTWVKANHTYKIGSEFRTEGYPPQSHGNTDGTYNFAQAETGQLFQNNAVNGANLGFGYASFLLGLPDSVSINNPTHPRIGKKQFGVYAQDSWKVTRRLTLDYGIRYDYSTYLREQYGRAPGFSATAPNPAANNYPGAAIYDGFGPNRCNCDFAHNYPYAAAPRLGAAYQINNKTVLRAGFGIVYTGTEANVNVSAGLASSGATSTSATFGLPITTLSQGIPVSFRPPPWPSYNPGQFPTSAPAPNTGPPLFDPNSGRPARQYQWSISIQRELMRDLVVEAAYVANRGVWWQAPVLINLNAITPARLKAFGLDPVNNTADQTLLTGFLSSAAAVQRGFGKPPYASFPLTQTVAQSLRPFPQFTTINAYWSPLGDSWYDGLQIKATKRLSHGLSLVGTFSWQKALSLGTETGDPSSGGAVVNDVFNRPTNKHLSQYDQPFLFNLSANYTTPRINRNKVLSWVARDWTYGVFLQYGSGLPIAAPTAQGSPSLNSLLFRNTFANRVPGQPLFTVPDLNCHCYDPNSAFVLNKNAWVDPPTGVFGTTAAYYSDYRYQRRPLENMNLGRNWRIKERASFSLRVELTNVFNRSFWSNPTATNAKANQTRIPNGNASAGFGFITTQLTNGAANMSPRNGVLVGRFTF